MSNTWQLSAIGAQFNLSSGPSILIDRSTFDSLNPKVAGINQADPKYHEYNVYFKTNIRVGDVSTADLLTALHSNPTPYSSYYFGYAQAGAPLFTLVYEGGGPTGSVTNITVGGNQHLLHPGVVQRKLVVIDGIYHIQSYGIGTGELQNINGDPISMDAVWDIAGAWFISELLSEGKLPIGDPRFMGLMARCFPSDTPILLANGGTAPIQSLDVGDVVLAFDPYAVLHPAPLVPARVTRLFSNVTDEWLVITPVAEHAARAEACGFTTLTVTPGHEMLDAAGRFRKAIDIVSTDARLMLADGTAIAVDHSLVVHTANTAELYEQAEVLRHGTHGGL
jgi:hypothetical protein